MFLLITLLFVKCLANSILQMLWGRHTKNGGNTFFHATENDWQILSTFTFARESGLVYT